MNFYLKKRSKLNPKWQKKWVLLWFIAAFLTPLSAQEKPDQTIKRNHVFVESYLIRHDFSSGLVSLNYARSLGKKAGTQLRIGVYPDFNTTISFPLTFTWLIKPQRQHQLELGLGLVFRVEFYESKIYKDIPAAIFPVMYRYQHKSGLFLKGGVNLFYSWPALISPSLGIGYHF
jgi:hypothetical protein